MSIVRHSFLKTMDSLFRINAWKNPPKKTVKAEKTAHTTVHDRTQKATQRLPNTESAEDCNKVKTNPIEGINHGL